MPWQCPSIRLSVRPQIFLLIDLVFDNSFFRFGKKVFRQKIGIAMGIDRAPQMANLYLYYYEGAFTAKTHQARL